MYTIRPAEKADAARCAAIYAPYTEGAITYEYPAPDAAEIARRMEEVTAAYPWLVCERDGEVIGYAYAHRFRERMAFDWTVEMSIYLDRDALGGGIGTALYSALIELLAALGYVNAIGTVATPNPPSERLHEKMRLREALLRRAHRLEDGRVAGHDLLYAAPQPARGRSCPRAALSRTGR